MRANGTIAVRAAAFAAALAASTALADQGDFRLAQANTDDHVPGIGAEGRVGTPDVGAEGQIGSPGIGMEGQIGTPGIGTEATAGEQGTIAGDGMALRVTLTENRILFDRIAAEDDLPGFGMGAIGVDAIGRAETIRFEVVNEGSIQHAFAIEGLVGGQDFAVFTDGLAPGENTTLTVRLPVGSYEVFDPLLDSQDRGMTPILTVE